MGTNKDLFPVPPGVKAGRLLSHDIVKMQGVPWLARKAIAKAPVSKKVSLVGNMLKDVTCVLGLIKVERNTLHGVHREVRRRE